MEKRERDREIEKGTTIWDALKDIPNLDDTTRFRAVELLNTKKFIVIVDFCGSLPVCADQRRQQQQQEYTPLRHTQDYLLSVRFIVVTEYYLLA
ncbi:hypothetical protein LWI28_016858 [Acer negundo]|uniref:At2g29880-like C-terminal domain-containing protein n=1 Tax=Acer negundo TaxID=4023 RepID=A0AAD5IFN9_ACENE|nr:hypothetical protein LWI28_016858 [Acer negundo]